MRIVSFNINSVRARIPQVEAIIKIHDPDVIGLQETKVHDDEYPHEAIEALGYKSIIHGQKGHYGVALLSKKPHQKMERVSKMTMRSPRGDLFGESTILARILYLY